jgi:isoquinoline 1-oxidoreductase beta subunit
MNAILMGGGSGGRSSRASSSAVRLILSRETKRPVKVMWTREDDVKNGWFRPAPAQKIRALPDDSGRLVAWHHRIVGPSILELAAPQRWANAKGKDILVMEGTEVVDYSIPNLLAEHVARSNSAISHQAACGESRQKEVRQKLQALSRAVGRV